MFSKIAHKMKYIAILINLFLITVSHDVLSFENTNNHPNNFKNISIQSDVDVDADKNSITKLNIYKMTSQSAASNHQKIWEITLDNLHVPQEACLEIDATLCADYSYLNKPFYKKCHDSCLVTGPKFVAYDDKSHFLYLDAGSNVSGTGGTPYFLFVADLNKKQVKYMNTFVGPHIAYLSPNGNFLALETGWNEINLCNTKTGESIQIRESSNNSVQLGLKFLKWLNNDEIKYSIIYSQNKNKANRATEKIYHINFKEKVEKIERKGSSIDIGQL